MSWYLCIPCVGCVRPSMPTTFMLRSERRSMLATWFMDVLLLLRQRWGRGLLSLGRGFPRWRHSFCSCPLRSSVQAHVSIAWVLCILDIYCGRSRGGSFHERQGLQNFHRLARFQHVLPPLPVQQAICWNMPRLCVLQHALGTVGSNYISI